MKKLTVDKNILRANLNELRTRIGNASLFVNLSGDGMGLGLVKLARLLMEEGVNAFAVTDSRDALTLRRVGINDARILILRSITEMFELRELMECGVTFTLGSNEAAIALNGLAGEMHMAADAFLRIDTGLGQYGFQPGETEAMANLYRHMPGIAISGIYTCIPDLKSNKAFQLCCQSFVDTVQTLFSSGVGGGVLMPLDTAGLLRCSMGEQSGLLLNDESAVLAGAELLGYGKNLKSANLKPVCQIEASLDELKWMDKGVALGGEGKKLKKPTRVAVVELGRYNGIDSRSAAESRSFKLLLPRKSPFKVKGKTVNPIGRMGEYAMALDVTKCDCKTGDTVELRMDPRMLRGLPVEFAE